MLTCMKSAHCTKLDGHSGACGKTAVTAPDVRTAAQEEALERWPRQDISVMHDADLSNYLCRHGFEEGAVWGAALVTPTRARLAMTVAQFFGPHDTPEDVADAILALMERG